MFQVVATTLYWFRRDMRVADNQGLAAAALRGRVVPVFVWTEEGAGEDGSGGDRPAVPTVPGAASRWWLHQSLERLEERLHALGSPLRIRRGDAATELASVAREAGASAVYWQRSYEPDAIASDAATASALAEQGLTTRAFDGQLLVPTERVRSKQGKPFRVFTPFWRTLEAGLAIDAPVPGPDRLDAPPGSVRSLALGDLGLLPSPDWAEGLRETWQPGEAGATAVLARFARAAVNGYEEQRDLPAAAGTSRLSPHLHFGEVSPRQVWVGLATTGKRRKESAGAGKDAYLRQLGWREFAHHVAFHFPQTLRVGLDAKMDRIRWRRDPTGLRAWQRGATGYPIVDAGMRELWRTGWMHNRVRMIVGSFLVKDLLIDWREGYRWFWDTLVDADVANNLLGWQWVAGCGADAAPFFRVFNPVLQSKKFDPQGEYIARWVPELAGLPAKWRHEPWAAPDGELDRGGVTIGASYPAPMVDHADARKRALAALEHAKTRK